MRRRRLIGFGYKSRWLRGPDCAETCTPSRRSQAGAIVVDFCSATWPAFAPPLTLLGGLVGARGKAVPGLLDLLLVVNPTDAYRLITRFGNAGALSGLGGVSEQTRLTVPVLTGALIAWGAVPLARRPRYCRRRARAARSKEPFPRRRRPRWQDRILRWRPCLNTPALAGDLGRWTATARDLGIRCNSSSVPSSCAPCLLRIGVLAAYDTDH